jgi:hypothetical protein
MRVDLLLLNCTNLPWRPIYPYAFVQVGALARKARLGVRTVDLLQIPRDRWSISSSQSLRRVNPAPLASTFARAGSMADPPACSPA